MTREAAWSVCADVQNKGKPREESTQLLEEVDLNDISGKVFDQTAQVS